MHCLIICEKDNAAKRIAGILSDNDALKEMLDGVPIYRFERNRTNYTVIGLRGHILSLDYDSKYAMWHRVPPRDLITLTPLKKPTAYNIVNALKHLATSVDEVVIATDFDREGELIGTEALEVLLDSKKGIPARRARFSSLTKGDVDQAFKKPGNIDQNLSNSALARQTVDLMWGATLTRFISIASQRTGKEFLSVGRVQTPTLAIIQDREVEINAFRSEPYWEIAGEVEKQASKEKIKVHHAKERFHSKPEAEKVMERVKPAKTGKVVSVKKEMRKDKPPTPFNTTQFLAAASTLGFAAARAMSIAEDLYTDGYISYPRTDNTVYPPTQDLREILRALARPNTAFQAEAEELLKKDVLTPTRGKKEATDHPPIHPAEAASKTELSKEHMRIYELVVRRFFATLADESVAEVTSATVDVGGEPFIARGLRVVEPGWRKYYTYLSTKENELPALAEGEILKVHKIDLKEKETQPPKRYTQGGLIQMMDGLGLGTKATRHEIIQKLYARDYVKDKSPVPTDSGIAVTMALKKYAEPITRPDMTATLDRDMDEIADGSKTVNDVVEESRRMLTDIFDALDKNRDAIGNSIKEALKTQNALGACPKCGTGQLTVLRSWKGKRFVGCSNYPRCRNSFPLPQKGRLAVNPDKCPACGNLQVNILHGRRKPWVVCLNAHCPTRAEREAARRARKEAKDAEENGSEKEGEDEHKDDDEAHLGNGEKKETKKSTRSSRHDEGEDGTGEGETEDVSQDMKAGE